MTYQKGQKLLHVPLNRVVEVVRDEGGTKVVVRIDGIEISVLRENLKEFENEKGKGS